MNDQKKRGLLWYLGEHPDLLQHYTDLQGLVRRVLRFFRRKLDQARQALRYFGRERKARRFPESDHRLAQMVLFIWGNLPRFGGRFRERLYHLRRRSIRSGSKRRALFEKIRLHPALFLGSAVAVAAVRPWSASILLAVKALTKPTSAGPMMDENLPKMSKKPKNSPLRALSGMSLPNIERLSA